LLYRFADEELDMLLTKLGHACIAVEKQGRRLVIDPGGLSAADALEGADAVLVTHEHFDHFDEMRLREAVEANPALRVWTNGAVAETLGRLGGRVMRVGAGDLFVAEGFEVQVYGELHQEIHADIPRIGNIGFLLDGRTFHPGDAFTVPDQPVEDLMVPAHAPWSRTGEILDWIREVRPARAFPMHDGALNSVGQSVVDGILGEHGPGHPGDYVRLQIGESARF
jgi:L-ascorbate metabolism protein UlaG (beta-lactamase superfamily)